MKDQFQRNIDYMRVSITDRCNLRCRYCMPNDITLLPMDMVLTYEEILDVIRQAAALGIRKIKVTGGEPLVRKNCTDLIREIKNIEGIEKVTLTTNGILLPQFIDELKDIGIDGINISLDTLQKERFAAITGFDALDQVMKGIDASLAAGIRTKINTVLQKDVNDDEWIDLMKLAEDHRLDVRFIELMPIGYGDKDRGINDHELREKIRELYPEMEEDTSVHGNGPATYIRIPGFVGGVGFIAAINEKFCQDCNRIRLTCTGRIKPCLCYGESFDLREILRTREVEDRETQVRETLRKAILYKPKEHCFEQSSQVTEKKKMSQIGG
ncbi:MAG: GTP 3',8-cyclase MoaA [Solobacterium sp.]|nr:GTP 3',8-cyclase MoaA [Solobacterium sp.]